MPETPTDFQKQLQGYRQCLEQLEQKGQADYDKAVMALSGGALGLSLTFLKEVVRNSPMMHPYLLLGAWLCWGVSVTCTLGSFYSSQLALRKAIRQMDDNTIYLYQPGGWTDKMTSFLNAISGILFLLGLILLVSFVMVNLPSNGK